MSGDLGRRDGARFQELEDSLGPISDQALANAYVFRCFAETLKAAERIAAQAEIGGGFFGRHLIWPKFCDGDSDQDW
jgi:hypothetical protein